MKKITVLAAALMMLVPCVALGAEALVQASTYLLSHDIAFDPITRANSILNGLDYPGEWVTYQLPALPFGTYSVNLKVWGEAGVQYHLELVTMPVQGGEPQTIDLDFVGLGVSCT
ncbi:MAG: hypothetical protein ABR899_05940 [Candidatus Krumholzibacteriaceae bacterium]